MRVKYIGADLTWNNYFPQQTKELKQNEYYDIEIVQDGPQMIVNGQPVVNPNSTLWVRFSDDTAIPYAPDLLKNFWEI